MKTILIQGSPKSKDSASAGVLDYLNQRLFDGTAPIYQTRDGAMKLPDINGADCVVIAFPLYVDGLPGHLVGYLAQLEKALDKQCSKLIVYAIGNCGFYEAKQNHIAMEMLQNWCEHTSSTWGQGLCIGGGGMFMADTLGSGPMTGIGKGLDDFCELIRQRQQAPDQLLHPNFPHRLYIAAAHYRWKKSGRKYGNRVKALRSRAIGEAGNIR